MNLELLHEIASISYIRQTHVFYLHNTLPPPTEPYQYYFQTIAPMPTTTVYFKVPYPLKVTVKNFFDEASDTSVAIFINAHYLKLLPPTTPAVPQEIIARRWPMAPFTEKLLKKLASQQNSILAETLLALPLPEPSPTPIFIPPRSLTSYVMISTNVPTIDRLAQFYYDSHLVPAFTPRTHLAKAGVVLDYILPSLVS